MALVLVAIIVAAAGLRLPDLDRAGFSGDEDLTHFAVTGIAHHGLPLLPSGIVYHRGLPYSYLAWASGVLFGQTLVVYRVVSFFWSVLTVWLVSRLAARISGSASIAAAVFVAVSPLHIVLAGWARFHSMFVATYVIALWLFLDLIAAGRGARRWLAAVAVTRLLHESAVTLAVLPLACWLLTPDRSDARARATRLFAATVAVLGIVHVGLYVFRAASSAGGSVVSRDVSEYSALLVPTPVIFPFTALRAPAAIVPLAIACAILCVLLIRRRIDLFACAVAAFGALLQVGLAVSAYLAAAVAAPPRALARGLMTAGAIAGGIVFWTGYLMATRRIALSGELVTSVARYASAFHGGGVYVLAAWPFTVIATVAGLWSLRRRASPADLDARLLLLLAVGWVFAFGLVNTTIEPRYVTILWTLLAIVAAAACAPLRGLRDVLMVVIAVATTREQVASMLGEPVLATPIGWQMLAAPRVRTLDPATVADVGREIAAGDRVVCTDEIACIALFGRADYWLLESREDIRLFTQQTARGRRGLYGGVPVIESLEAVRDVASGARTWIVLADAGRASRPSVSDVVRVLGSAATRVETDNLSVVVVDRR